MSRTSLYLNNNSDETLEFRIPNCELSRYDGSDFEADGKITVPAAGVKVGPRQKQLIGSIGDPGSSEYNHWGWIFLYSEKHDDFIQCYIISKGENATGNTALIDWYRGKRIDDGETNVSGSEVGKTEKATGSFTLEYHPAEDFTNKTRPKLPFDFKISADLIETFSLEGNALRRTNSYALTVRMGPNALGAGGVKLSASYDVDVTLSGDVALSPAARGVKIGNVAHALIVGKSGGCFTITMPVTEIATPVLYLDFTNPANSSMPYRVELHPAELTLERLKTRGGDVASLRSLGTRKPKMKQDDASLNAASKSIAQLRTIERHLSRDPAVPAQQYIHVEVPGAAVTMRRDPAVHELRDCCFGVSIADAAAHYYEDNGAQEIVDACKEQCKKLGIDSGVVKSFDGFWDTVREIGGKVVNFFVEVIKGVINVFVRIGEFMYSVVMTIASEAIAAIEWVFENVLGLTLDDVVSWLGYIFDWDAICKTQQYFVKTFHSGFATLLAQREPLKKKGALAKDWLIRELGLEEYDNKLRFKAGADVALKNSFGATWQNSNIRQGRAGGNVQVSGVDLDGDTPSLRWAADSLAPDDAAAQTAHTTLATIGERVRAVFDLFITDAKDSLPYIQATGELVAQYFDNVTLDTLPAAIGNALLQLATGLIKLIEDAADLAIDLAFGLLEVLHDMLSLSLPIPFVSALYRQYVDSKVSAPNIVEMATLIAAIPASVICNLVFDRSPFVVPTANLQRERRSVAPAMKLAASASAAASAGSGATATQTRATQDEQLSLALTSGFCQTASSILYPVMEAFRISKNPYMPVMLALKLSTDITAYSAGIVSLVRYTNANPMSQWTKGEWLELGVGIGLGVGRVTDFVRLMTFVAEKVPLAVLTDPKKHRKNCGTADTFFGALGLFVTGFCAAHQSNDLGSSAHPDEDRTILGLKATQYMMANTNSTLSWPREELAGHPEEEGLIVGVRCFVQFSNGVLALSRACYIANLPPTYTPLHGAHSPVFS